MMSPRRMNLRRDAYGQRRVNEPHTMDTNLLPDMWVDSIGDWIAWLIAGGLPPTTIYLRNYQLRRFASFYLDRGPWALDTDDLAAWLACHQWKKETLRSYRAALRSFYGWAHASGIIGTDPARLLRKIAPAPAWRPRSATPRSPTGACAGC